MTAPFQKNTRGFPDTWPWLQAPEYLLLAQRNLKLTDAEVLFVLRCLVCRRREIPPTPASLRIPRSTACDIRKSLTARKLMIVKKKGPWFQYDFQPLWDNINALVDGGDIQASVDDPLEKTPEPEPQPEPLPDGFKLAQKPEVEVHPGECGPDDDIGTWIDSFPDSKATCAKMAASGGANALPETEVCREADAVEGRQAPGTDSFNA